MTGSTRIVDHMTFTELQWKRDSYSPSLFRLPPGFQVRAQVLTKELVEILEDIHALSCIRVFSGPSNCKPLAMANINNHQASIQSRLVGLVGHSPILECCKLAAYLCSSMLCCQVWCALVIPVRRPYGLRFFPITFLSLLANYLVKKYSNMCQKFLLICLMTCWILDSTDPRFLKITSRTTTSERRPCVGRSPWVVTLAPVYRRGFHHYGNCTLRLRCSPALEHFFQTSRFV